MLEDDCSFKVRRVGGLVCSVRECLVERGLGWGPNPAPLSSSRGVERGGEDTSFVLGCAGGLLEDDRSFKVG